METWIKLYRRFTQWEWFDKPEMVQLFVWLLLEASSSERTWHGTTIKRGQLLTTEPAISAATGLTRQQIRTCLGRLIGTNEIERKTIGKSTDKKTLITICRYDDYQSSRDVKQPSSNRQATDKQPTKQECKNNIIISSTAPARTREDEFIDGMKKEQEWLNLMAKMNGLSTAEEVVQLLDKFRLDCECRTVTHTDITHSRRHFIDWLRKYRQSEREAAQKRAAVGGKNVNDLWR